MATVRLSILMVRCRVCRHAKREVIEAACSARELADVAFVFGVSERSLERHMTAHAHAIDQPPPTERSPVSDPPSSRIRRFVLDALERHPEARADVLEALDRAEVAA